MAEQQQIITSTNAKFNAETTVQESPDPLSSNTDADAVTELINFCHQLVEDFFSNEEKT